MRRPLDFSLLRFAAVFALALAGLSLRPASVLWRDSIVGMRKNTARLCWQRGLRSARQRFWHRSGTASTQVLQRAFYNTPDWSGTSRIDFTMHINDWASNASAQYGALAHSLLNGRLDLEKDPPAAMAELQKPLRHRRPSGGCPRCTMGCGLLQWPVLCLLWDRTLPSVPAALEAPTGVQDLPPSLPMILLAWLYIAAVFGFVRQAVRRWFPDASAAACLLAAVGAASGAQLWYLLHRPSVYEYAILCGAVFVLWALWQWLLAANTPLQKARPGAVSFDAG